MSYSENLIEGLMHDCADKAFDKFCKYYGLKNESVKVYKLFQALYEYGGLEELNKSIGISDKEMSAIYEDADKFTMHLYNEEEI